MNSPEAYIQFKPRLIGDDGGVTDASTAEFLADYMAELHGFIARVYTVLPRGKQQPARLNELARH